MKTETQQEKENEGRMKEGAKEGKGAWIPSKYVELVHLFCKINM